MSAPDENDDGSENTVRDPGEDGSGLEPTSVRKPSALPTEPLAPPKFARRPTGESPAVKQPTGQSSPGLKKLTGVSSPGLKKLTGESSPALKKNTGESPAIAKPSGDTSSASTPRDEAFLEATAVRKPSEVTPRDESFLEATAVRKPNEVTPRDESFLEATAVRRPSEPARPPPPIESLSFLEPTAPRKKSPEQNFADRPSVQLSPPPEDPLIGQMLGEYRVLGPLGKGGQGIVYRGEQPVINRPVAIKVLKREFANDPKNARRFLEEARSVSAARHPGIIDIFSFGETPAGEPYLVMELLEGEPLDVLLRNRGALPEKEVIALLIPILSALSSAHAAGVIHRDLKPGNVFVVKLHDGTTFPKVLDFGLARRGEAGASRVRQTSVGGTPLYVAPEQVRGEAVGPQTDLYSLGCMAYELLAGRPPFYEGNLQQLLDQHLKLAPKPLRPNVAVSAELEQLVLRLLEKDLTNRPQSAREVREQLEKLRDVASAPTRKLPKTLPVAKPPMETIRLPAQPAPTTTAAPAQPSGRPFPMKLVVGGLVLVAVIIAGVVATQHTSSGTPSSPVTKQPGPTPVGDDDDLQPLTAVKPPPAPDPAPKPDPDPVPPKQDPKPEVPKPPRRGAHTAQEVKERWRTLSTRAKSLPDDLRRMALLQLDEARYCKAAPDTCWRELSEIETTFFPK